MVFYERERLSDHFGIAASVLPHSGAEATGMASGGFRHPRTRIMPSVAKCPLLEVVDLDRVLEEAGHEHSLPFAVETDVGGPL
jgi:hypothetical protein